MPYLTYIHTPDGLQCADGDTQGDAHAHTHAHTQKKRGWETLVYGQLSTAAASAKINTDCTHRKKKKKTQRESARTDNMVMLFSLKSLHTNTLPSLRRKKKKNSKCTPWSAKASFTRKVGMRKGKCDIPVPYLAANQRLHGWSCLCTQCRSTRCSTHTCRRTGSRRA